MKIVCECGNADGSVVNTKDSMIAVCHSCHKATVITTCNFHKHIPATDCVLNNMLRNAIHNTLVRISECRAESMLWKAGRNMMRG